MSTSLSVNSSGARLSPSALGVLPREIKDGKVIKHWASTKPDEIGRLDSLFKKNVVHLTVSFTKKGKKETLYCLCDETKLDTYINTFNSTKYKLEHSFSLIGREFEIVKKQNQSSN
jgi:hypothetical protein